MLSTHCRVRLTSILTAIIIIMIQLTACNSGEGESVSSADLTGVGVVEGVTPEVPQAANLSWVAPVEREDGTPISMAEIAGYRVYYGTTQGDYAAHVEIADSTSMQVTLSDLTTGTYYIVVTVVDMDGRESGYSQEVIQSI